MANKKNSFEEFDKETYLFPGIPKRYTLDNEGKQYCGICFELKPKREFNKSSFCAGLCRSNNILVSPGEYEDEEKTVHKRYIKMFKELTNDSKEEIFTQLDNAKNNLEEEIEKAFQEKYGRFNSPIVPEEIIEFHYNIQNLDGLESIKIEEKREAGIKVLKVERIGNIEYKTIKTSSGEETLVRRIPRRRGKRHRKS